MSYPIVRVLGNPEPIEVRWHLFAGGEPHCSLDPKDVAHKRVWVEAHVTNFVFFGYLLCVLDAIHRARPERLALYLPYFPGGRQDHPEPGTPRTLSIYADALRRYALWVTVIVDPHSYETETCLPGIDEIEAYELLPKMEYNGVIAPDKGAIIRARRVADSWHVPLIQARKIREQATGKLSGFECDPLPQLGRYLIVDDICDGGATFNGLADVIHAQHPGVILDLYVTHGIFSRGDKELKMRFERIYTTDSLPLGEGIRATVIPVLPLATEIMEARLSDEPNPFDRRL